MSGQTDYSGMAAFSICEALLLAINDHKLLPEREVVGVLSDAAATHENAGDSKAEKEIHRAIADLINHIIIDGNLARRS